MIIGGSTSQDLAAKVAEKLGKKLCYVENKKFPDGERYLKINGAVEEEVTIIQSTGYPQDENILELLFLIKTAKDIGAKKVRVVMPYMGYARQEKRFNPGEAVSSKIVAELVESAGADEFITFNIHEKCVLDFFNIPAKSLSAIPAIAKNVGKNNDDLLIVAPDKGAYGFAREIAEILDCQCTYLSKVRHSGDNVETRIVDVRCDGASEETVNVDAVKGKRAIIIDDIIATGGTIVNAINILKVHGAESVDVCCVHPILVNGATARIYNAGARSIISTNSISSDTSRVSLADIIAEEIK